MVENIDTLKEQVEQALVYSQAYPFENLSLDNLMQTWREQKQYFIELFGDNLIWRSDEKIKFTLTDEDKASRFSDMISIFEDESSILDRPSPFGTTFRDFLCENESGFFNNEVVSDYPKLKIRPGMKLLRCFKYFMPNFTTTRWAQDIASRFIQDSKIEGYIYFSVHPLDFLTLSENDSNWRSCHSLDGEYRAGNLSYMTDDTTAVVYLANEKQKQLKCFPEGLEWYDKKWRMLIHTNQLQTIIYYDRQYPFNNDILLNSVRDIIVNNFSEDFSNPRPEGFSTIKFDNPWGEIKLERNYILGYRDRIYDTLDIVNAKDFLGYCDLIYSSYYRPILSLKKEYITEVDESQDKSILDAFFHRMYDIKVGGKVPCVKCGSSYVERSDSFLCNNCIAEEDADTDFYLVCESCGSRIYDIEDAHRVNDELLCDTCFSALDKQREGVV